MTINIRVQTHGEDCAATVRKNSEEPERIKSEDGVNVTLGNIGDTFTVTYERHTAAPSEQEDTSGEEAAGDTADQDAK